MVFKKLLVYEGSLQPSQNSTAGPYSEPVQPSCPVFLPLYSTSVFTPCFSDVYFNIIFPFTPESSMFVRQNFLYILCSPCMLYVLLIIITVIILCKKYKLCDILFSYFTCDLFYHIQLQEPRIAECGCDSQFQADVFLVLICWCVSVIRYTEH
jgi:hypothetical protein